MTAPRSAGRLIGGTLETTLRKQDALSAILFANPGSRKPRAHDSAVANGCCEANGQLEMVADRQWLN